MPLTDFAYVFIPIFVAMDPGGMIPVFLGLTEGLDRDAKARVAGQAVATAFLIGMAFVAAGRLVFRLLGISEADFQIAGGLLLLVFAIVELYRPERAREAGPGSHAGVVPLGTPLIMGPAVMTSMLILIPIHGYPLTIAALLINLALVAVAFRLSGRIVRLAGENGLRAASKVINVFLAAIGVSMIRRGFELLR